MNKIIFSLLILSLTTQNTYSQKELAESINYYDLLPSKEPLDKRIKNFQVTVEIPYITTLGEVRELAKQKHNKTLEDYHLLLKESQQEHTTKIQNHDKEVTAAEDRYRMEMKEFKALSLLERLALTEQNLQPKLKIPAKPIYVKPSEPKWNEPNLDDFLIFDKAVLEGQIILNGYSRGSDGVLFSLSISEMEFQDNGGQTFFKQPAILKVILDDELINQKQYGKESKFLTATSSNKINLERYEKENVNKIINNVNNYINELYGKNPIRSFAKIKYLKNKKREYDQLENAKIKAQSAYRKFDKEASEELRNKGIIELYEATEIWKSSLGLIEYQNKKSVFNSLFGKVVFYNLLQTYINLRDKANAEKTLAVFQEKRIDLILSKIEEATFQKLEDKIYKL